MYSQLPHVRCFSAYPRFTCNDATPQIFRVDFIFLSGNAFMVRNTLKINLMAFDRV